MALPATDTFASATPPVALQTYSGSWTIGAGAFQIVQIGFGGGINVVQPNSALAHCMAYWNVDVPDANQYSQAKIYPEENNSVHSGVAVRCSTTEHTTYDLRIHSYVPASHTATYELYRFNAGTPSLLATSTTTFDDDDTLRLEVSGTGATVTLVCKRNGTQFASFNDTDASRITAAGRLGQSGYSITGGGLRDWEGGNLETILTPAQAALTLNGRGVTTSAFQNVRIRELLVNGSGQAIASATDITLLVWYAGRCGGAPDVSLNSMTTDADGTTSWSIATGTLAFNQAIFYVAQNSVSLSHYAAARMTPSYE
mgnify:CR=1 FL=1